MNIFPVMPCTFLTKNKLPVTRKVHGMFNLKCRNKTKTEENRIHFKYIWTFIENELHF